MRFRNKHLRILEIILRLEIVLQFSGEDLSCPVFQESCDVSCFELK